MSELSLGAALYFDHELAADPAPLEALWRALAKPAGLLQWWATAKRYQKLRPVDIKALVRRVASGTTTRAAIESQPRGFLALASTEALAVVDPAGRHWIYDAVIALGPRELATIGVQPALDALCEFAGAVAAKTGMVVWTPTIEYATALAHLASGPDLPRDQVSRMTDASASRDHWGRIIRGPEWGTFLGPSHLAAVGELPAAKVVPLAHGGALVQATAEPLAIDTPSPELDRLRDALAPVSARSR